MLFIQTRFLLIVVTSCQLSDAFNNEERIHSLSKRQGLEQSGSVQTILKQNAREEKEKESLERRIEQLERTHAKTLKDDKLYQYLDDFIENYRLEDPVRQARYIVLLLNSRKHLEQVKPDWPKKKVEKVLKSVLNVLATTPKDLTPNEITATKRAYIQLKSAFKGVFRNEKAMTNSIIDFLDKQNGSEYDDDYNDSLDVIEGLLKINRMVKLMMDIQPDGDTFVDVVEFTTEVYAYYVLNFFRSLSLNFG